MLIIGLGGGTGSGKTTVVEQIVSDFPEGQVSVISQDSYYKDLSHLSMEDRTKVNFDHPNAIDFPLLCEHLRELKEGRSNIFVRMSLKGLKDKKWFRILSNKYLLILIIFVVWMFFFDGSSWLLHRELSLEKEKLEGNRDYFKNEIETDKKQIEQLKNSDGLERFAREEYLMKKDNEEIYIIEYKDSIIKTDED